MKCMKVARGGVTGPGRPIEQYPPEAWYTYNDPTCDKGCQASEYHYWATMAAMDIQLDFCLNSQGQVCFGSIAKHSLPPPDAALPGVLLPGGRRGARARQVQRALLFRVAPGALAAPPAPRRSPRARGGTSRGVFALC